jgi:hypothetical protein
MHQSEEAGSSRVHIRKYKVFDILSLEIGLVLSVPYYFLYLMMLCNAGDTILFSAIICKFNSYFVEDNT